MVINLFEVFLSFEKYNFKTNYIDIHIFFHINTLIIFLNFFSIFTVHQFSQKPKFQVKT